MAIIAHVDLDAFFASCEHVRHPEYDDRAVVVCIYSGRGGDSGAVSAADYTARDYGIHAGMPIVQAKRIAEDHEDVVLLPADKEYYAEVSGQVMDLIRERAGDVEQASIDEAYADLSGCEDYEAAEAVADAVRDQIDTRLDVTASIGIGPNKLVAKIASDANKPDGTTLVEPDDVERFLGGKPVDDIPGVGPKTMETFAGQGVETVADLRSVPRQQLVRWLGEAKGVSLHRKAHGDGAVELEEREAKQLSRITTLSEDTADMADIRPVIRELAEDVMDRVRDRGWRYRQVSAICITTSMQTRTRSKTFKTASDAVDRCYRTVEDLVASFLDEQDTALRRVGVRTGDFEKGGQETLDAFR